MSPLSETAATVFYTIYQSLSKRNCWNILNQPDIQTHWGEKFVIYAMGDYVREGGNYFFECMGNNENVKCPGP